MSVPTLALILFSILIATAAQLLLKAGANAIGTYAFHLDNLVRIGLKVATNPYIVTAIACYVVSVVTWIMALSRVEVSVAYPMVSLGYVLSAAGAWYFFGESVTPTRLLGIAIIILGVYVVARS